MSLQPLDKRLRKQLENTIVNARSIAESAARSALERLSVGASKPGEHLTEAMRQQRNKLRAHGRQLGDIRQDNAEQGLEHLVQETAYEQWHRMLFARFLTENNLLMHEDGVSLSIQDCFELAADEEGVNGWELAGRYASAMLPQIFKSENPALAVKFSPEHQRALEKLLEGLDAETFQASDSLGWVYQYWQTQRKEAVNKSGNKIGADELSAVTQLFTEPYMVSFLLDNSLGAWWVSNYPDHKDLLPFQYLRYAPEQSDQIDSDYKETTIPAAGTFQQWPKNLSELKMLDPCCGSGHFLVATLLMLVPMRMKAEGLSADEAIARVLSENIHGLELDQRCVEIAVFAVALEAWRYPESSGYRPLPSLNIAWVGQSIKATKADWLALAGTDDNLYLGMEALYNTFKDAPLLGSLIDPSKSIANDLLSDGFEGLQTLLNQALQYEVAENQEAVIAAKGLTLAVDLLSQQYELIATNVPYLSRGKQCKELQDFTERHYQDAKGDIANVFLERCLELNTKGGVTQMVMPQNWLFLGSYKKQREHLLKEVTWNLLARLGANSFETPMYDFNVQLLTLSKFAPNQKHLLKGIDASEPKTAQEKATILERGQIKVITQTLQVDNPDARVVLESGKRSILLSNYADGLNGMHGADSLRFRFCFWEITDYLSWSYFQCTNNTTEYFGGKSYVFYWPENGKTHRENPKAYVKGESIWGKSGVVAGMMRDLPVSLYSGDKFDISCSPIVPKDPKHLPAIWCFCSSPEFNESVRQIDQALKVTNATLVKVPFDLELWTQVAQEKYPNGLPKPYSDDPTQWIFHGHPAKSEAPLQVAVARLLGYQWPAESDKGMELSDEAHAWIAKCESLSPFVDDDGIVCLSPVRGEKSADERLEVLLMAAFGEQWNGTLRNQLLMEVQCSGKTLNYWLREKFFEQHCKLFQNRPFIWHIWDGLADGFNALVNYHQLDRQNLERLIYAYLGDWIRTQDHGVKEGVDGAVLRLQAAQILKTRLETILEGEAPYDIFVRWKTLAEQPLGWNPDINDGVRMNIRPFMSVPDVGKKEAGILRTKPNIKWTKDRGNDVASAPWYTLGLQYGESAGSRINDHHLKLAEKKAARDE
jgi:N-6 DNA Methylase